MSLVETLAGVKQLVETRVTSSSSSWSGVGVGVGMGVVPSPSPSDDNAETLRSQDVVYALRLYAALLVHMSASFSGTQPLTTPYNPLQPPTTPYNPAPYNPYNLYNP